MRIPYVNDQQLDKVLEAAASPVVMSFLGSPDRSRDALWRWRLSEIADDWDDRAIFMHINAVENPEICLRLHATTYEHGLIHLPVTKVFLGGVAIGTAVDCARPTIEALINRALKVRDHKTEL